MAAGRDNRQLSSQWSVEEAGENHRKTKLASHCSAAWAIEPRSKQPAAPEVATVELGAPMTHGPEPPRFLMSTTCSLGRPSLCTQSSLGRVFPPLPLRHLANSYYDSRPN